MADRGGGIVTAAGRWAKVSGYEHAYEVHTGTGQCRSVDRWVTSTLGRRRFYRGQELELIVPRKNQGSPRFNLSIRGRSHAYTPAQVIDLAVPGDC